MSKPYLLYLGNGRKMESLAKLGERFESWDVTVDRHWAYNGEFPDSLDGYDGIFLSGSPHGAYEDIPFIHREHDLIAEASAKDIPMLGVCFGSQILASALCGRDQVFRRDTCEIAYKDLPVTEAAHREKLRDCLALRYDSAAIAAISRISSSRGDGGARGERRLVTMTKTIGTPSSSAAPVPALIWRWRVACSACSDTRGSTTIVAAPCFLALSI